MQVTENVHEFSRISIVLLCGMLTAAGCIQEAESMRLKSNTTCSLSPDQLDSRKSTLVEQLKPGVRRVVEHEDGYALEFPGDGTWDRALADFVVFERGCCSSIAYELSFPADRGPVWLRLRADAQGKEFFGQMLADVGMEISGTGG